MSADITAYQNLVTSEHRPRPKFMAVLGALVQPFADCNAALMSLPGIFDLDNAAGQQLDMVGQWIGQSRLLTTTAASQAGVNQMDDAHYSPLLHGLAYLNSQWDGSTPVAYEAYKQWWNINYGPNAGALIQDNGDLSILLAQYGAVLDQQDKAIFNNGYMDARLAGILVKSHVTATAAAPLFGLDAEGEGIAGLDVGCWGTFYPVP